MRIPVNSTDREIYFVAKLAGTRVTGLSSFTVVGSRNGATPVAFTSPTVTELDDTLMPGVYALLVDEWTALDADHDNEELALHITGGALMDPVTRTVEIYRPKTTEGQAGVNLTHIVGVELQGTGVKDDSFRPA